MVPALVESLQLVGVSVARGGAVAERGELEGEHGVGMVQRDGIGGQDGALEGRTWRPNGNRAVEHPKVGEQDREISRRAGECGGIQNAETVGAAKIQPSLPVLEGSVAVEVVADQAVAAAETRHF